MDDSIAKENEFDINDVLGENKTPRELPSTNPLF